MSLRKAKTGTSRCVSFQVKPRCLTHQTRPPGVSPDPAPDGAAAGPCALPRQRGCARELSSWPQTERLVRLPADSAGAHGAGPSCVGAEAPWAAVGGQAVGLGGRGGLYHFSAATAQPVAVVVAATSSLSALRSRSSAGPAAPGPTRPQSECAGCGLTWGPAVDGAPLRHRAEGGVSLSAVALGLP